MVAFKIAASAPHPLKESVKKALQMQGIPHAYSFIV